MGDPDPEKEPLSESRPAVLPRWGDALAPLVQRFGVLPQLGAVVVDASPFDALEQESGRAAREHALANLGSLVRDVAHHLLEGDEIVVGGETGRAEVAVLALRAEGDRSFYRQDLPNLARAVEKAIERRGHRLVYPFSKEAPMLGVGYAAVVRNPFYAEETQIRRVLADAREAAGLAVRSARLRRRQTFLGLLMAGRVTSVYEPIVDVATRTVFGYEALARGPQGTEYQMPGVLFAAAEAEDLVYELDCLCRRSGLDGAVGLPEGTNLFLNVRPTTIHDPSFRPDTVVRTLERARLIPAHVVFEISEQESIQNFEAFREIRDEYRALGFRFALDDTGSGYASLQAVIELEPDFIKVDRALVTGLDTDRSRQLMLRALQEVAHGLGASIIGEGLDTLEELAMLGELGIPFGQGWLFGKPTPLLAGD